MTVFMNSSSALQMDFVVSLHQLTVGKFISLSVYIFFKSLYTNIKERNNQQGIYFKQML